MEAQFRGLLFHRKHPPSICSVITETCGVFITRGSEERGRKFCTVKRNLLLSLIRVQQQKNFPLLFKFPHNIKTAFVVWFIQTLEAFLESHYHSMARKLLFFLFFFFSKKGGAGTAAATTDNKTFSYIILAHDMTKKWYWLTTERMMCLIRGGFFWRFPFGSCTDSCNS